MVMEHVAGAAVGAGGVGHGWCAGRVGAAVAAASSDANRLVRVSGTSPFTGCPTAGLDALLPTGEVEPVVVANPTDRANVVAAWTQDRFRGVVAGVSLDRGRTWRSVVVPGLTRCTGGAFDYADDRSEEHTSELQSRTHLVC